MKLIQRNIIHMEEDMFEITKKYVDRKKNEINLLNEAVKNCDYDFMLNFGHKLSGSAANYGMPSLGHIGRRLELASMKEQFQECRAVVSEIEQYIFEVEVRKID